MSREEVQRITRKMLEATEGESVEEVTYVLWQMIFYAIVTRAVSRQAALGAFNKLLEEWILQVSTEWDDDRIVAERDRIRRAK